MFGRGYRITLNRVHDTVRVVEGAEKLTMTIDADPGRLVAGLTVAQAKLKQANTNEAGMEGAARYFASVIFGDEQAGRLFDFYRGDPGCVINLCGRYFNERLAKLIDQAQRRAK